MVGAVGLDGLLGEWINGWVSGYMDEYKRGCPVGLVFGQASLD